MDKKKIMGQVFTPKNIVCNILDTVGYTPHNIQNSNNIQRILEPSFGDGVFLTEIINRLLQTHKGKEPKKICNIIDNSVYGIELDEQLYNSTVKELKDYVYQNIGLVPLFSHLYNMDALDFTNSYNFDFIVGNPPYIRMHNINKEYRKELYKYQFSTGNSDLYIIFFEKFINMLSPRGEYGFITPNSWIKNSSQKSFRKYLIENKLLKEVKDYGSVKVFNNISTYVAITYINYKNKDNFIYKNIDKKYDIKIDYKNKDLKDNNYTFNIRHKKDDNSIFLNDICDIKNGIATLADKMFIKNKLKWEEYGVEEELLIPAVKGSKLDDKDNYILFPYSEKEGKIQGISEKELKHHPYAYLYLKDNKEKLEKRSTDKKSLWFWFGRSQSLNTVHKNKVALSHSIDPKLTTVRSKIIPSGTVIYSGIMLLEKEDSNYCLQDIKNIIDSEDFYNYCVEAGKPISHGWITISTSIIKKYPVPHLPSLNT